MRNVLIGLIICLVAANFSCARKPLVKHHRDTSFVKQYDSAGVVPKDSAAEQKVQKEIETIYLEVAADCPNVPKEKVTEWKERTQKSCSMESLSGGKSFIYFPLSKDSIEVTWKGNKGTAVEKSQNIVVNDKTEITYPREKEKKMGFFQLAYRYPKEGLLIFFLGFATCAILFFVVKR